MRMVSCHNEGAKNEDIPKRLDSTSTALPDHCRSLILFQFHLGLVAEAPGIVANQNT